MQFTGAPFKVHAFMSKYAVVENSLAAVLDEVVKSESCKFPSTVAVNQVDTYSTSIF